MVSTETNGNHYAYFHDLEQTTRTGLVSYLIILVAGLVLSIAGVSTASSFVAKIRLCEILLVSIVTLNLLYIFIRGVNKIHWLGEMHVWIDAVFFRFLAKSDRIILREILNLLEPHERARVETLVSEERTAIARTIFTQLAEDPWIFESLLRRGMFRSWIWYWITIYGVLVFLLLAVTSFVKALLVPNPFTKALFTSMGVVGVAHVGLGIVFGFNLILVTRRIIREITSVYHTEVVTLLRKFISRP